MIYLKDLIRKLNLEQVSAGLADQAVAGGYAGDLLSCAMKGAKKDFLWVTLQSHLNVVAVASLLNLAGVIITEGNRPGPETIARADQEGIALMITPKTTYTIVGELTLLGVKGGIQEPGSHVC